MSVTRGRGVRENWVRYWNVGPWEIELEWVWKGRYFAVTLSDTRRRDG